MALTRGAPLSAAALLLFSGLLFGACSRRGEPPESGPVVAGSGKSSEPAANSAVLGTVNQALKAGAYDDAAARLLELHASGRNFTAREATEYRKALNEAYTRALEAAENGDKRAEAAIQMIRAANNH